MQLSQEASTHRSNFIIPLCLFILFLLATVNPVLALRWSSETADAPPNGTTGKNPAIAVDDQNRPHIAYRRDPVMPLFDVLSYATKDNGVWTKDIVDQGDVGYGCSIDVTGGGTPHMAYQMYNIGLGYASGSPGSWSAGEILAAENIQRAEYSRTRIHPSGVYILLRHAEYISSWEARLSLLNSAGGWSSTLIASNDMTQYIDLAVASDGTPHVVYASPGAVKYSNANLGWVWDSIHTTMSSINGVAIALDAAGYPHIAFRTGGQTYYGFQNASGWNDPNDRLIPDLNGTLPVTSLTVDADGIAHFLAGITYVSGDGSQWRTQPINGVGADPRMAFDSVGNGHVASFGSNSLKYSYGEPIALSPIPNGDFEAGEIDWYDWGESGDEGIVLSATDVLEQPVASGNHVARLRAFDPWSNGYCVCSLAVDIDTPTDPDRLYLSFAYQFLDIDCTLTVWLGGGWDPIITIPGPAAGQTQMQTYQYQLPFAASDKTDTRLMFLLERTNSSWEDEEGYTLYLDDVEWITAPAADITDNGIVNYVDFSVVSDQWGQTSCGGCGGADLTGDNNVAVDDLLDFVGDWLWPK